MKKRHIRYSGAARWAVLSLLTLMGSSVGLAQEEQTDVTEQVGVTSVMGKAAEWTFTMPGYSVKADVEYYTPAASVTKDAGTETESTQTYDTFVEALIAAEDGDVLTLCKDIDIAPTEGPFESGQLIIAVGTGDHPLTLDLNGHTLAFPEGGFLTVSSDGYLKVTDGTEGGNGKLTSATSFAVWVCYGGYLAMKGGCVETTNTTGEAPYKSAVYNQGVVMTDGGTVSGILFAIYNDGVLHLGEGKIAASQGFGVVGSSGQMDMLKFPEFDCMSDDIALNDGQLIYYGGKVYGKPKNKIKIYLENKEQKYFTYGYGIDMVADPVNGGITDPSDVFYVSGISDARIGFCSRTSNYYDGNELEAGIADETEITFPAGNSTYFDERALALGEWNDDLKFYAVTGVDTENKNVILTEVTSKRFGEHAPLIVSNTSGAPITVKMVEAASSTMANSFLKAFNDDLRGDNDPDEVQIYPYFEGTNEAIEQIDKLDGFTCYDLNGEDFVPLSNLGPVEAHSCWLMVSGLSSSDGNLSVVWPGTLTGVSVVGFTGIFDAKSHTVTATIPDGATIAYGTTDGQYDLTTAPAFTAIGTHTVYYKVSKQDYKDVTGSVIIEIKSVVNENGGVTLGGKTYLSLSDLALTYITNPAYKQMVLGLVAGITASDIDNFINRLVLDDNLNLVIKKGPNAIIGIVQANAGQILKITGNGQMTIDQDMLYKLITEGKVRALSRAAGGDMEVESGVEYLVLQDCDLFITVYTEDADVTISDMSLRLPGDANDDKKVNAADIVEMVNEMDPNKQPSEKFNLQNADMNGDKKITQEDIDAVVDLILQTTE